MRPTTYDPTAPVSIEYWLTDFGARRPQPEVMHVIAASETRAFRFATEVAAARGLDLETVARVNLA